MQIFIKCINVLKSSISQYFEPQKERNMEKGHSKFTDNLSTT